MKNGDHETIPTNKVEDHGSYFDTSPPSPDNYGDQGNLFKGIDKKTIRREGFSKFFNCILFSAQPFSKATRMLQKSCTLLYIDTLFSKNNFLNGNHILPTLFVKSCSCLFRSSCTRPDDNTP
jgi:hypothetical protein